MAIYQSRGLLVCISARGVVSLDHFYFFHLVCFSAIVEFIDDRDQRELWEGLLYAAGMFVVAIFQTLVIQQYFKVVMVAGLKIRTAVLGIVYKKVVNILSNTVIQLQLF